MRKWPVATRRGIRRRLIGSRSGAINRGGAARTLRAQKQLTWPAAPIRSTRQPRFAQAPDEASNPPLKAGFFRVSFGAVGEHSTARRWPGRWPLRCFLRRRSLVPAALLRQTSLALAAPFAATVVDGCGARAAKYRRSLRQASLTNC